MTRNSLLTRGYRECARLTWRHGTTYFWGAALLPRRQRKHVYAVYALCRLADDIVDVPSVKTPLEPVEGHDAEEVDGSGAKGWGEGSDPRGIRVGERASALAVAPSMRAH